MKREQEQERDQGHDLQRGAGFGALVAVICLYAFFAWLKTGQAYLDVVADTHAKQARAAAVRAAHDRRLVQTYEPALIACLKGDGFVTDRATVQCDVTRVAGGAQ